MPPGPIDPFAGYGTASQKETHALRIALLITWTFAVGVSLALSGIFLVVMVCRNDPPRAKALLLDTAVPAMKEVGVTITALFGSLLAFVLGYYFGEKKDS